MQKQFAASIRSAVLKDGRFFVPAVAEKVVRAWVAAVTAEPGQTGRNGETRSADTPQ